jgi:halimadienyl-diphosphate synthase
MEATIREFMSEVGPGHILSTAYDTAWAARLIELGEPIGRRALDWLRENQLSDGTWGAATPGYYHDRLISTLAAAIALKRYGNQTDQARLARAKEGLETVVRRLANSAMIETIGFELIIPTLFREAESAGIIQHWDESDMPRLNRQRTAKLAALPGGLINRYVTLAFSAEMAGADSHRLLDIPNLQEANGSVGHSPSATAYFALELRRADPAALNYLRHMAQSDGGMPDVAPFDNFERSWTLWNLKLVNGFNETHGGAIQPHLDTLRAAWRAGKGTGYASGYSVTDADLTAMVQEVLFCYQGFQDVDAIFSYEKEDYFQCYALEANPSISANIHVLSVLRQLGFSKEHPAIQKIVRFLQSTQFWFDKWHISPYYPTSHAIIACAGFIDTLVEDAVSWIMTSQNEDGSWGQYAPTTEETAYCLQALVMWKRAGHSLDDDVMRRGYDWLSQHQQPPYLPLWIGKGLYSPTLVVRSAVLSALTLVQEELGYAYAH